MVVDWITFIEMSLSCNWGVETTLGKIEEAVKDVYGNEYSLEVVKRLKWVIGKKHVHT